MTTELSSPIPRFHLAVPVDDLAAARTFYGGVLGLEQGRSADTWVDWNLHGHQFVTHLAPARQRAHPQPRRRPRRPGAALRPDPDGREFHALADRLRAAGTEFVIEPYVRFAGPARRAVDDVPPRPGRQRAGVQGVRRRLPGLRCLAPGAVGSVNSDRPVTDATARRSSDMTAGRTRRDAGLSDRRCKCRLRLHCTEVSSRCRSRPVPRQNLGPTRDHTSSSTWPDVHQRHVVHRARSALTCRNAYAQFWGSRGRRFKSCRPDKANKGGTRSSSAALAAFTSGFMLRGRVRWGPSPDLGRWLRPCCLEALSD